MMKRISSPKQLLKNPLQVHLKLVDLKNKLLSSKMMTQMTKCYLTQLLKGNYQFQAAEAQESPLQKRKRRQKTSLQ
jgi:hypothetical protein